MEILIAGTLISNDRAYTKALGIMGTGMTSIIIFATFAELDSSAIALERGKIEIKSSLHIHG